MSRVFFKDVREKIKEITHTENFRLTSSFEDSLIDILPSFFNYKEEDTDINPSIIFLKNIEDIEKKSKMITKISIKRSDLSGNDLKKNLKMLLPFCNSGWTIFLNFTDTEIEYGLLRAFTGIRGFTTVEELFSKKSLYSEDTSLLAINLLSPYELSFKGIKESSTIIDFRFAHVEDIDNLNEIIEQVTNDFLSGLSMPSMQVRQSMQKIITTMHTKSNGSILLILKSTCKELPKDIFMDGTWLETPIDLVETLNEINSNSRNEDKQFLTKNIQDVLDEITSESEIDSIKDRIGCLLEQNNDLKMETELQKILEKYYAYAGLLYEMINIDGVTIVNNIGQVIGYNCFAKSESEVNSSISGGARKRAFTAIQNNQNSDIVGVYFQSQNGEKKYKKRCNNE